MTADRYDIFRELEPPAGGPARMRAKLAAVGLRHGVRASWLAPVAVALIAAVALVLFRPADDPGPGPDVDALLTSAQFDRLLGRETAPFELVVTRGEVTLAVHELETRDPNVRFFRIEQDANTDNSGASP